MSASRVDATRWRLRDVALVALLYVLLHTAGLIVLAALGLPTEEPTVPMSAGQVVRQLEGSAVTVAAVVIVARRRGDLRALLPLHVPAAKWVRRTAVIAGLLLAAKAAIASTLPSSGYDLPVAVVLGGVLSVGLATAIDEELLYRGVLYGWMSSVMRPAAAAICTAGVFAVEHAGLQAASVVGAFAFGLLVAGLYRRSGSLVPGIFIHAVSNVATLAILHGSGGMLLGT